MILLFFGLGIGVDYCFTKWAKRSSELSYKAVGWTFALQVFNISFYLGLIETKSWVNGLSFALGLCLGTYLAIRGERSER